MRQKIFDDARAIAIKEIARFGSEIEILRNDSEFDPILGGYKPTIAPLKLGGRSIQKQLVCGIGSEAWALDCYENAGIGGVLIDSVEDCTVIEGGLNTKKIKVVPLKNENTFSDKKSILKSNRVDLVASAEANVRDMRVGIQIRYNALIYTVDYFEEVTHQGLSLVYKIGAVR